MDLYSQMPTRKADEPFWKKKFSLISTTRMVAVLWGTL